MAWGSEKDIEKVMIAGMREGSKRFHQTDHPDFKKDEDTGTVINKNMGAYKEYKAKRERGKEFLQLRNDVESLKVEVAELRKLINKE